MRKTVGVSAVLLLAVCATAIGQPSGIAKFFPVGAVGNTTVGLANIQSVVGGYVTPIADDFGAISNGGWYHTAANHKKWGFDLNVTMNTVFASSESKSFPVSVQNVDYNGTNLGNGPSPTAYGAEQEFPIFNYNASSGTNAALTPLVQYRGPSGGNLSAEVPIGSLAVPSIQGGLGLFANTDIRFRFTPGVKINETKFDSWGVGLLHDIKQHFPGIKIAPFSLSVLVAYSQLNATTDLSGVYFNSSTSSSYTGQEGLGETSSWTAQVLISKSIPVVTFYGGLGYGAATTKYSIRGDYWVDRVFIPGGGEFPLVTPVLTTDPDGRILVSNPYSQEFTTNGFRATGGIRLKFGPIFLNGDYTLFNSKGLMSLGFGLTVR